MGKCQDQEWLFSTLWVHVFEEDTDEGAVYRREDGSIPLSRRPRERFELRRDGAASVFTAGADDRMVERPATWSREKDELVVRAKEGGAELRIVDCSETRLLVRDE